MGSSSSWAATPPPFTTASNVRRAAKTKSVRIGGAFVPGGRSLRLCTAGEIVGLAGLEGHGQKDLLRAIYETKRGSRAGVTRLAPASFVSGDRQKEGVFPLWNVLANIAIGRFAPRAALGLVSDRNGTPSRCAGRGAASDSTSAVSAQASSSSAAAISRRRSFRRAVAALTPIVLLDDPTRGVDIATKQDFYRLCSELAREGRTSFGTPRKTPNCSLATGCWFSRRARLFAN